MAKIYLNIEAEDAADLRNTLIQLSGIGGAFVVPRDKEEGYAEDPDAGSTQDADPGERQPRKRRSKAEMAADAALAAAGGQPTSASATRASTDSAEATPGQAGSSKPSDPFGDQIKEVVGNDFPKMIKDDSQSSVIDKGAVSDMTSKALAAIGAPAVREIFRKHGAEAIRDLDTAKYGEAYADLKAAAESKVG